MALKQPNLDDRTYADLLREGIGLIPVHAPEWTNHNAADPGITLIELFAYMTEILLYRSDRVTDRAKAKFVALLTEGPPPSLTGESLNSRLREVGADIRKAFRAVSAEDFEALAHELTMDDLPDLAVGRAQCFSGRDLEAAGPRERERERPGHISLVFIPNNPWLPGEAISRIRTKLRDALEPRRLLTSKVHVVGPNYMPVSIGVHVLLLPGVPPNEIEAKISGELRRFFDPLRGGLDGRGWPFGGSVNASDVGYLVETLEGVDQVTATEFGDVDSARPERNDTGEIVRVRLHMDELVHLRSVQVTIAHRGGNR